MEDKTKEQLIEEIKLLQRRIAELEISDIERKKMEEVLLQERKQFRGLFDHMSSGVAVYEAKDNGEDFIFKDINKAAEHSSKVSKEDVIGKSVLQVFPGVKKLGLFEVFQQVWKTGKPLHYPVSLYQDERISQWVENYVYKLPSGEIAAVYDDVTERKKAEEALRQSEEKYKNIVDNIGIGVTLISPDMKILSLNKQMKKWNPHIDLKDKPICHRAFNNPPREEICSYCPTAKTLKDGLVHEDVAETPMDSQVFNYRIISSPIKDETGKVIAAIEMVEDITKHRQAEQALEESKSLMDAVIENIPLMIFLKEAKDLRFVIFNRAGEELLGYDRKSLLGKNNLDLFPAEQAAFFMAKDREVLDGKEGILDIPEEFIMTAKKGQRLLHTRKVCIRGVDGTTKYLLGISEDITERKETEEKDRKHTHELEVFYKASVGREERIIELKKEIEQLKKELGK